MHRYGVRIRFEHVDTLMWFKHVVQAWVFYGLALWHFRGLVYVIGRVYE